MPLQGLVHVDGAEADSTYMLAFGHSVCGALDDLCGDYRQLYTTGTMSAYWLVPSIDNGNNKFKFNPSTMELTFIGGRGFSSNPSFDGIISFILWFDPDSAPPLGTAANYQIDFQNCPYDLYWWAVPVMTAEDEEPDPASASAPNPTFYINVFE